MPIPRDLKYWARLIGLLLLTAGALYRYGPGSVARPYYAVRQGMTLEDVAAIIGCEDDGDSYVDVLPGRFWPTKLPQKGWTLNAWGRCARIIIGFNDTGAVAWKKLDVGSRLGTMSTIDLEVFDGNERLLDRH
jgi:hypothetical protein